MDILRSRTRTTKWLLFFNYFTAVYAIISGIVLVPLYLYFIPLDLYGAWLATGNIVAWIGIVDPGLSTVLMQRTSAAYGNKDFVELNGLLTNGILLSGMLALLILVAGVSLSEWIFALLYLDKTPTTYILSDAFLMAVVGAALMTFSYGVTAFNIGLQSSLGIGLVNVVSFFTSLGLSVLMLFLGYGLMAIPAAIVFRGVALTFGNIVYLVIRSRQENLRFRFTTNGFRRLTSLLSYSFMGKSAGIIASNMDVFVVARYLGAEAAAVLVLTKRAPDLSRTFLERPAIAFMPAVANLYAQNQVDRVREILLRLLRIIIWFTGLAGAGFISMNEAFVTLWVGSELYAGDKVNVVIVFGLIILVFATVFSNLCYALGNIKGNSIATLAQSLLSIPFMILGVKFLGMVGVVLAPLLAALMISSWYYPRIFSKLLALGRADVIAILRELSYVVLACVGTLLLLFWINISGWMGFIFAGSLIVLTYISILALFSINFRAEFRLLVAQVRHLRRGVS